MESTTKAHPALERHYTAKQITEPWALDESTIRKMFRDEPGVLVIGVNTLRPRKRQYATLRIPESVMLRVHASRLNRSLASPLCGLAAPEMGPRTERNVFSVVLWTDDRARAERCGCLPRPSGVPHRRYHTEGISEPMRVALDVREPHQALDRPPCASDRTGELPRPDQKK
jgi:hypothetical protein